MAHKYEVQASPPSTGNDDDDGHRLSPARGMPLPPHGSRSSHPHHEADVDEVTRPTGSTAGTPKGTTGAAIGAEEQALIDALLADTGSNPEAVELLVAGYKSHHGSAAPSAAASPSPMRSNVNTRDIVVRGAPMRDDVGLPAHRMRPVSMGETLSAVSPAPGTGKTSAPAASPTTNERAPHYRADQTVGSLHIAALSPARSVHDRQSNAGDTPHDPVVEWATSAADQVTPSRDRLGSTHDHDASAVSPSRVSFNMPPGDSRLGYQAAAASSRRRPPPPPPPGASSDDDEDDGLSPPSRSSRGGRPSVVLGRRREEDFVMADVSLPPVQPYHHAAPLYDDGDAFADPGMPVGLVQTPADLSRQNTARRRPPPPPPPLDSDDDNRPSLSVAASENVGAVNAGFDRDPSAVHDSIQQRLQGLNGAGGGGRRSGRRAATPDYTRHLAAPRNDDDDDAHSYTSSYSYTYDYGSSSYTDSDDFTDDDDGFTAPARGQRGPGPQQQHQRRPLAIGPPPNHAHDGAADPRGYGPARRQPQQRQQRLQQQPPTGRRGQPQGERARPQATTTRGPRPQQPRQRVPPSQRQGATPAGVVVPRLRGVGSAPASARSSQPRTRAPSGQQHLNASPVASSRHPPVHSLHPAPNDDGRTPPRKRNAAIVSPPPVVQSPGSATSARTVVAVPSHRAPPVDGRSSATEYSKEEKAAPRRRGMCC